ncbi:hypothetical protein [Streptomyces pinistramenti]|uniref:hypothetical protein n=1 Tax=Streptomyces pinistramenti TaxID=2884812 RepID=UPI001D06AD06|nr:hypothetical protein [Streptomyces pinistramenti]MCB5911767.1 hypothetical protein [Streptomyces pinistramenti]
MRNLPGTVGDERPRPRRSAALVAGAAVAVIALAAAGGWLLWGHHDDTPAAAGPPAVHTAGAPPTTAAPATTAVPSSPAASAVPEGFRLVHDTDKGFTTAVPEYWERSSRKDGVFYTSKDGSGLVQIFEIKEPDTSPRQALEEASKGLAGNPGYEEIALGPLDGPAPGTAAAQLVYAYDSKRLGKRVKVVDCAFTADDGRQFAVLVLAPEDAWPQQEDTQRVALEAFAPDA